MNDQRDINTTMCEMLNHASVCIKVANVNRRTTQQQQLLTGMAAAFIPPSTSISLRQSCDLFGMNHHAIYVARGMQFWLEHDACMKLTGAIEPGEPVEFCDGYGVVKEINAIDDSVTKAQYQWNVNCIYCPVSAARMHQEEPDLLNLEPKTRSDMVATSIKSTSLAFHIAHGPQSPNAKDQMSRRHPDYPRL
jgi:hypothetical protein